MNKNQIKKINNTIRIAKKSNFYKTKLKKILSKIKNQTDFKKIPLTTKKDLRKAHPFGSLSVNMNEVVEVHTSSGTTGKATLSFYTKKDLLKSSKAISKAWEEFNVTSKSRIQFMMSYGLFSGAAINTYALQHIGAFVLPAGIQSSEKQIKLIKDFKIDTIVGTPSYYNCIYDFLTENKITPNYETKLIKKK